MNKKTEEIFGMLQQVRQMGMSVTDGKDFIDRLITSAVEEERERCAKIIEKQFGDKTTLFIKRLKIQFVKAIRDTK